MLGSFVGYRLGWKFSGEVIVSNGTSSLVSNILGVVGDVLSPSSNPALQR